MPARSICFVARAGRAVVRVMMIGPYPRSPEHIDGGVSAAMTYLSRELARQPALVLRGVRIGGEHLFESVKDFGWPIANLPLESLGLLSLYRSQRARLRQLIREFRPDIVHAQGIDVEGFLAVRSGVPTIVTVHGVLSRTAMLKDGFVARSRAALSAQLTELSTVRRATDLISISPYVARQYRGKFTARVHEIPNPVADTFFSVERHPERGRVLFAGRVVRAKGVLELVRAFAQTSQEYSRLILAGSCPDERFLVEVRREIEEFGIEDRVRFVGLLSEGQLQKEFARARCLVLPSYQETAPMVIQQAMAAGLLVIATRVGGVPDMLENGSSGFLVETGNTVQIAEQLSQLETGPNIGYELEARAKAIAVANFQAPMIARMTRNAYEICVSDRA